MKNCTVCSVCGRTVAAKRNWARDHAGQSAEWRISRHRVNEKKAPHGTRETICGGSSIVTSIQEILAASA